MTSRRLLLAVCAAVLLAASPNAQTAEGTYTVRAGDTLFRIARTFAVDIDVLRRLNGIEGDYITVGQTLRLSEAARPPVTQPAVPPVERPPAETGLPAPIDPVEEASGEPVDDERFHTVQAGETLFRIALRYDTSVEALRRLNNIDSDRIKVGQRLRVGAQSGGSGVAQGPAPPQTGRPIAESQGTPVGPVPRAVAARPVALSEARPWDIDATTIPADRVHFVEPGETLYGIAAKMGLSVNELLAGNALSTAPLEPGTVIHLPRRVPPVEAAQRTMPPLVAEGLALVYPDVMAGRATASGEAYDPLAFGASHREYPFGTVLLVTNPANGRSTFVRVIDRGPVSQAYLLELSAAAATALDLDPNAARRVEIREVP